MTSSSRWFLYALRCADDSLYTGVTTDLTRRLSDHNSGRGARYTSGRRPVQLIGAWLFEDRSAAQRAEARFRNMPRRQKLQHIARKMAVARSAFYQDETISQHLTSIRFCPRCGGLLKAIERPDDDRARRACTACGRVDYQNAKPCAGVLAVRDARLLLVRRAIEPYLGYWDIPGGFLEVDELPYEGAVREVEEETGLEVKLTGLFGFYMGRYGYGEGGTPCLNIYFLGQVVGGNEQPGDDASEVAWFTPEDLPEAVAFDHSRQVLRDWTEHVQRERQDSQPSYISAKGS
jgi:putative endonuclease